jgi:hypothetical protein
LCIFWPSAAVEPRDRLDAQEALVDAVNLDLRGESGEDRRDAPAHVAVERVVARKRLDAVALRQPLELIPGGAHLHPQRLHFVAAGDDAAIVVGEHDDRRAGDSRIEGALAGHEKIVAIDQRELRCGGHAQPRAG